MIFIKLLHFFWLTLSYSVNSDNSLTRETKCHQSSTNSKKKEMKSIEESKVTMIEKRDSEGLQVRYRDTIDVM